MTVNASNTRELNIDELILRAAQLGGVMAIGQAATGTQWNNRAAFGRDQLELILKRMPTQTAIQRHEEWYTFTITSLFGGPSDPIVLASDTVDVLGFAMYKETSTDNESRVEQVDWQTWQGSLDKAQAGRPTRFFVQRGGTLQLYLLPVPSTASAT
jgi:hypothetical protein